MALSDNERPTLQGRKKDTNADLGHEDIEVTGVDAYTAGIWGQRLLDAALSSSDSLSSCGSEEESELSDVPFSTNLDKYMIEQGNESEDEAVMPQASFSSRSAVKQQRLKKEETLTPHPTSPTKVIATLSVPKLDGSGTFLQIDEIPEIRSAAPSASKSGPEDIYFHPSIISLKLPPKIANARWVLGPTTSSTTTTTYTRTIPSGATETFTPTLILRAFSKDTNVYAKAYSNTSLLASLDPNSSTWATKYSKWIHQVHARSDPSYEKVLARDAWTAAERAELYTCINEFVDEHGLSALGVKGGRGKEKKKEKKSGDRGEAMKDSVFADWADRITLVSGIFRSKGAVRSQFFKTSGSSNRPIFELLKRAERCRMQSMGSGAAAKHTHEAISKANFPAVDNAQAHRAIVTKKNVVGRNNKRKRPATATTLEEARDGNAADTGQGAETTMPPAKKRNVRDRGNVKALCKWSNFGEKTQAVLEKARALLEEDIADGDAGEMGEDVSMVDD